MLLHLLLLAIPSHAAPRSSLGNIDFPDPSPAYDPHSQAWYAFATQGNGHHVQAARAPSALGPWSFLSQTDLLPDLGPWVNAADPRVWAPDVQYLNASNSFVLYYSALARASPRGRELHCVGAATSRSITGPYRPFDSPLICPLSEGGAIDAAGFYDQSDGSRWVLYKVDGNALAPGGPCGNAGPGPGKPTPIRLQRVDEADGVTLIGRPVTVLDRDPRVDGPLVEAPSLVREEGLGGNRRFVLFYSSRCFNTVEYGVNYAVSEDIQGPYVRMSQLLGGRGPRGTLGLEAPGGATAVPGGGGLLFHADCPAGRCMHETRYVVEGGRIRIA
ncbi:glycoside hydrolase family 43 protein [Parathielavia appendiculata]|uniref:Glycoside hydrolase family 43 protein n=1 Tax=Parathielavia appendiculata TaxID=2587402 RepID=A0AAN6UDP8_9PEZI|nr:glycoside hydrolase family 43 protein [Parathielavia appendiculata]